VQLATSGGLAPAIPVGGMVIELPNNDANAELTFREAGLVTGDAPDFNFNIRNNNLAKNVMTITYPTTNPNKITFALPATPVSSFNGSITILSGARKVTYQGVITKPSAAPGYRCTGFFLLPQLPAPGQSTTTSPVLSGQVTFQAN
jgi:hypothetical protein